MPNRMLYEPCRTSERLGALSPLHRWLWVALLTIADDFGRYYGSPAIVTGACLPFDAVPPAECNKLLDDLHAVGLVQRYESDGRDYLQLCQWRQRVRAQSSKFPAPTSDGLRAVICPTNDGQPQILENSGICTMNGVSFDRPKTDASHMTDICPTIDGSRVHPRADEVDVDVDVDVDVNTLAIPAASPGAKERYTDEFLAFWERYPRKTNKRQAFKAWKQAKRRASVAEIMAGLETSPQLKRAEADKIPYPASWLNGSGFEDDPESEKPARLW